ncbi:mevalonate kinase [Gammaproteobacteria bacterium]
MDLRSYKVSAPGSLMLFGEHAVLHGRQAVVTAVNNYIQVELVPSFDRSIRIVSAEFGEHVVALDEFAVTSPYDYVLTAIKQYLTKIDCGFLLHIRSEFPPNIGFGSSAAVTVATIGALAIWLEGKAPDLMWLYKQAVKVIRSVHSIASGADVAASVFGGLIVYQMQPLKIQKLNNAHLPLIAVYSGWKTPTFKVIAAVEKKRAQFPAIFADLYNAMGKCAKNAALAIKKNDLARLGELMNIHQGLQDAIGVNNNILAELILDLRAKQNIYGAKISGAGMGDCAIGLGEIMADTFPRNNAQQKLGIKQIRVAVSATGFNYEAC